MAPKLQGLPRGRRPCRAALWVQWTAFAWIALVVSAGTGLPRLVGDGVLGHAGNPRFGPFLLNP
jgi:hypothetical protein